jgi:hypothetical protein
MAVSSVCYLISSSFDGTSTGSVVRRDFSTEDLPTYLQTIKNKGTACLLRAKSNVMSNDEFPVSDFRIVYKGFCLARVEAPGSSLS